jgi:hypothetical protein
MRKQTAVLLFLLGLSVTVFLLRSFLPSRPGVAPARPVETEAPPQSPLFRRERPAGSPAEFTVPSDALSRIKEQSLSRALPRLFEGKGGSYTNLGDLFQGDGSREIAFRSDWISPYLFRNRNLPTLRMRVIQNPQTGQYRISGSSLALPGTGLEAGYEAELNSEEYKAAIQWKKSF